MLKNGKKYGTMCTVRDGYLVCPSCQRNKQLVPGSPVNKRLLPISPQTTAKNLEVYCQTCKRRIKLDIAEGQCFESQG